MATAQSSLVDRVLARDPRAVARAISLCENESPAAAALVGRLVPQAGRAYLIGLTGPPGSGKSTLADRLVTHFRQAAMTVGVLAVDPTSPYSGGAILGDRLRMNTHAGDSGVFIRSMATRGQLGGLARATADAALVLDAAGFDAIIIETVGVGQDEVDIVRAADVSIVIVAPGAGDEVQALKAGIMEIADIFVVNKADRDGADHTAASIEGMLSLDVRPPGAWRPPVIRTEATAGRGVAELAEAIARFRVHPASAGGDRRRVRAESRARDAAARQRPSIDHVGVAVQDPSDMVAWFQRVFGLATSEPETVGLHRVRFVETGDSTIEFVEPASPDASVARYLATHGPGLHHICLRVSDIDATLALLKARGVTLIDEVPRPGAHGSKIAFIHPSSACGLLIEIKQPCA